MKLRLASFSLVAILLLSGCPMSMSAPDHDTAPGSDAGILALDAPRMMGADAPIAMGTDAPVAMGTDAPSMMGADAPIAVFDGGSAPDAGMVMTGVTCGADTCLDPEICCVNFMGGAATMECGAPADCMGVAASCDGPEDCTGSEVCCATRGMGGPGGGGGTTECVADTMCRFGRLCHADSECGMGDTCCSFMGASVCSPFCP
jgi:hypothetical protein